MKFTFMRLRFFLRSLFTLAIFLSFITACGVQEGDFSELSGRLTKHCSKKKNKSHAHCKKLAKKKKSSGSSKGSYSEKSAGSSGWRKAELTHFTSYPAAGSDECLNYNGCTWSGMFAALDGKQSRDWVKKNNIVAVHEDDFKKYKLKTLMIRKGGKSIKAKVYDMCADSDCNGCCTKNSKKTGFLLDLEDSTAKRFGEDSGIVEWTCLDCGN